MSSVRITDRGIEIDGQYQQHTTRIQLDVPVPPEPARIVVEYIAIDFDAELTAPIVEHEVYIAGVRGTGRSVRDAVADVLREMEKAS